jgi:hypothetical protein
MSAITESGGPAHGHEGCLFCGKKNPFSLRLAFQADPPRGVRARFRPHEGLQGYAGRMHGGAIAGVLDAAMTHCLFHSGVQAVTGDLHVRFLKPAACQAELDIRAWIVSCSPPLYRLKAELSQAKDVLAWAEGKFLAEENSTSE